MSMGEPGAGQWLADGHPVMTVSSPRAGSWADHCLGLMLLGTLHVWE